ncbi:MAG: protein kinase [Oligoflexales bacterium]
MNTVIGKVISGRYKIVSLAGQGGMGKAYKAIPLLAPAENVIIKLISHHNDLNKVDELHRFQTEASHLSKLYHPYIVSFHEFGFLEENLATDGLSYYLVMDWVEGQSLGDFIESGENDLCFFYDLGMQIALALDYTHRKNIIHRDLKPSNIMMRKSNLSRRGFEAVILDFGIARLRQSLHFAGESAENFKGDMIGTPLYMSPEQTGFSNYTLDHRTDLYSLGCILFEILAGRPPFYRGGRNQILKEHARSQPPSIKALLPNIPNDVDYIITKLLAKNPSDRYQSGMQLFIDLKYLQNQPALGLKESAIHSSMMQFTGQLEGNILTRNSQRKEILELITAHKEGDVRGMIISIQSEGGGGKSKLLKDLQTDLKSNDVKYISGEFLDYASSMPFQVISSAFNDFIIQVESSKSDIEVLCMEVKKRIGSEISLLCTLVPMLRKYFPDYDGHNLFALTKKNNFQTLVKVFSDFLKCIGTDNKKLVFMFDDLHKADEFSIKLLDIFVSYTNTQNFTLIMTYHPYFLFRKPQVSEFLKKIQRLKRRYLPFAIKSLSPEESEKFLANNLNFTVFKLDLDRVYEYTKGNPRHLTSFWTSLLKNCNFSIENGVLKASYNLEFVCTIASASSVEQCFLSLQKYDADEWLVMEMLSALGKSFSNPGILGSKILDRNLIEKTLNRMEDDGLLSKIRIGNIGESELIYQFSHYHLHKFFYSNLNKDFKNKVHLVMLNYFLSCKQASKLENLSAAIYHTLALSFDSDKLSTVAEGKVCEAFCRLGDQWKQSKLYFRSELVYQDALRISEKLGNSNTILLSDIILSLCDLWFETKSWDEIINLGEKTLLSQDVDYNSRTLLQKKYLIPAYLIQGHYHKVLRLVLPRIESRKLLSQSLKYSLIINFLRDLIFMNGENILVQTLLLSLKINSKDQVKIDEDFIGFDLWWLQILQEICLDSKLLNWIPFHLAAIKIVKKKEAYDSLLIVRLLTFRAVLWSQIKQYDRAEKILNLLVDLAYSMQNKQMIGYTTLIKGLIIDYDFNHYGDLKLHLNEGLRHLQPIEHPTLVPKAVCLQAFMSILSGKFSDADHILKAKLMDQSGGAATKVICGAFLLFIYFIQGRRDLLVDCGEHYLEFGKSLKEIGTFEMYFLIISMFVEYAKGDVHKTRTYYAKIAQNFSEGINSPFLFTYERDFVSLIILCIPMIFEQEHQRKLMRNKEMRRLLKSLKSQVVAKKSGDRDIFFLLKARVLSDLEERSGKKYFDRALKIAFMLGNDLISCFIYLWYGQNLGDLGSKKQEYISKAYEIACDRKFLMLQSYIESLIKSEPTFFDKEILLSTFIESSLPFNAYPTNLALSHLSYISKSSVEGSTYVHSLNNSLRLLKECYEAQLICIVLVNQEEGEIIFYPRKDQEKSIENDLWAHLQSFLSLTEASFLPSAALPLSNLKTNLDGFGADNSGSTSMSLSHDRFVLGQDETHEILSLQTRVSPQGLSTLGSQGSGTQGSLDAYVPIGSSSGTMGVLLLREVPERYSSKNMKMSARELDLFGAQLGLVIERDFYSKQTISYSEQWDNHSLEPVPWLNIRTFGTLANTQISAWTMGLAMPDEQYLIVFCSLQGGDRAERQHLSSMIWHHIMVMQVLLKSPDRSISIEYLRDQFASLLKVTPGTNSLGDIGLAFTIMSKGSRKLASGHFGHARPLVLGGNNQVKPFNDPVMSYDNGRELRFWEVLSSWEDRLPLLLCAESSRYVEFASNHIKVSEKASLAGTTKHKELSSMNSFFTKGTTPPFYVAVLPNFKGGY